MSWQELRDFVRWFQKKRALSDRTVYTCISQLRFFTFRFISTIPDLKQKTMVAVMYSAGLRIGEVCHLRYEDIDRKNMRIHVRHSKSRSSRYAILSQMALDLLTQYWFQYGKPRGWLFPK